jgi:hypothetical protein
MRHKASRRRAVLFRQLRASATYQICDLKQPILGDTYITQELFSGQRLLKGFARQKSRGRGNKVASSGCSIEILLGDCDFRL